MQFVFGGGSMRVYVLMFASILWMFTVASAQAEKSAPSFATYLTKDFDYSKFTCFEVSTPPTDRILQSNGFLALEEEKFGKQIVLIPAPVDEAPGNTSDRLLAMEI